MNREPASSDLIKTLSDLVALPSVNPMGRPATGPEFFEYRVTDYLENFFRSLGVPYQRQTVEPKRDNIVARLDGDSAAGDRVLLYEAHQDTVPVTGMTIEPWTPTIRDGRIYGRGACDIKGGLAAMLTAFARLVRERPAGMPTVLMASTVNEENGFSGVKALCRLWEQPGSVVTRRPDAAVISEPTELSVVVAHKGVVRWRLHTHGRAAHASQPERGENAIYRLTPVLAALERYAHEVVPQLNVHPLCGRPTLNVGTVQGGLSVNTVPDRATIEIDRRVSPGEDPRAAFDHVVDYLASALGNPAWIEHDRPFMQTTGLADDDNGPLADNLLKTVRSVVGRGEKIGVPYGTNASATNAAGIPSVVFGPGSITEAHTADEWLALDQLALAAEVYYRFAGGGLRLEARGATID
ncbi:MAG TPA: M20 family metallopeptidase [Pirellulales bacterium]|jgi:acetylornithine deacetylase|nr:M20 family metallopeptidase [Pirellulales bacterium]